MLEKKKILLKVTGNIFSSQDEKKLSRKTVDIIAQQIKMLSNSHQIHIVIGGGNFFRGTQHGASLGITKPTGHQTGMLATIMNGVLLKDILEQNNLSVTLLSSIFCPSIAQPINEENINKACNNNETIIFVGGTGNPFFTTDTNAVIRSLQINADELWKATNVNGIYDKDPHKNDDALLIKNASYKDVLEKKLNIMDQTAFTLADEQKSTIRIFNIFAKDALLKAAQNKDFGSTIV